MNLVKEGKFKLKMCSLKLIKTIIKTCKAKKN